MRLRLPLAARAALLAAPTLGAQDPVVVREAGVEVTLPPGFDRPAPVGLDDGPRAPRLLLATRAADGATVLVVVAWMDAEGLARRGGSREAALTEMVGGMAGGRGTVVERTDAHGADAFAVVARVRDGEGRDAFVRAVAAREGVPARFVAVVIGPVAPGAPRPAEFAAALASLRLLPSDADGGAP